MIIEESIAQGSDEWRALKLGVISASGCARLVSPTGKVRTGDMPITYRRELLAERLLGASIVGRGAEGSYWTDRGVQTEPQARAWFAMHTGLTGRQVGFVWRDKGRQVGCSPDWLLEDGSPAEVKAPAPWTHLGYLLDGTVPDAYIAQVHFQIWCCGAAHGWFVSFFPALPGLCLKVERDEKWITAIETAVADCRVAMAEEYAKVEAMGVGDARAMGVASHALETNWSGPSIKDQA
jgi:hypothetical protein